MHLHDPQSVRAAPAAAAADDASGSAEAARSGLYALLGRLLLAPPDVAMLQGLQRIGHEARALRHSGSPLIDALAALGDAAEAADPIVLIDEYAALFLGPGQPAIDPYGSRYLSGHLHDRPLVALRHDLARLGIARRDTPGETEDHLGALFEVMRLLIDEGGDGHDGIGDDDGDALAPQRRFFAAHLFPWADRCLADLEAARGARFYRDVAEVGRCFVELEQIAFGLDDEESA